MGPSNVAHKGKRNRGFKEERFFFYREKSSFLRSYFFPSGLHRPCHGVLFFAPFLIVVRLHIPLSTLSIVNFSDYCRIGTTATSFHSTKCRFTILPLSSTTFRYVSRGRRKEICVLLRVSLSFPFFLDPLPTYSGKSAPRLTPVKTRWYGDAYAKEKIEDPRPTDPTTSRAPPEGKKAPTRH